MSHITHTPSHSTHTNKSHHTYEWVMSRIQMNHVTHTNESCHTYERVTTNTLEITRINESSAFTCNTHTNESCDTYKCIAHANESRQIRLKPHTNKWVMCLHTTQEWVTWHIQMRDAYLATHTNVSHIQMCHTYPATHTNEWHTRMRHVTHTNASRISLPHVCTSTGNIWMHVFMCMLSWTNMGRLRLMCFWKS